MTITEARKNEILVTSVTKSIANIDRHIDGMLNSRGSRSVDTQLAALRTIRAEHVQVLRSLTP